jgi:hypothetical protein
VEAPVFELHIRPLFRAIDRDHMRFAVDLWDYDSVRSNANEILARLETDMPPEDSGGPWPAECLELFRRWTTTGFRRLELGTGEFAVKATASVITLTATGTFPAAGYRAWLDIESATDTARTYVLWFEPPESATDAPGKAFSIRERFRADSGSLFVRDATGIKKLR